MIRLWVSLKISNKPRESQNESSYHESCHPRVLPVIPACYLSSPHATCHPREGALVSGEIE